jgi:alpha-tubulin suppressor-like RCC1 family protein
MSQGPASQAALEAQINGLINSLHAPQDQGPVFSDFARIKAQLASGRTSDAQTSIVAFVKDVLSAFAAGDLEDPNGAAPPSTSDALAQLVNSVAQFGGLPAPIPPSNPLGSDGAVAVVGPAGGTVVSSNGFGGVQFPAGALPADVIVVVERLPNPSVPQTGPLPTLLDQYPLFYDFSTTPLVPQFGQDVTVGICQLEVGTPFGPPTQVVANRLQLAHPDPANPGTVELLQRVPAPFIDCSNVTLAYTRQRDASAGVLARAMDHLRDAGRKALGVLRPTPLYAVHGGLGGRTRSFSPFGAVDPGITPLFDQLAVGTNHACAITAAAQTWCWGARGPNPHLGDGTPASAGVAAPVQVFGNPAFASVASSGQHTCGILATGVAMCWGRNGFGQIGDGTFPAKVSPSTVLGGPFAQIAPSRLTTCGRLTTGAAYCWGHNQRGEVGNPSVPIGTSSPTPVAVATTLTFRDVAAGWLHACGVEDNGGPAGPAHCWGTAGMVGDGTFIERHTPVPVAGGLQFTRIFAGALHTCALTASGAAYCWGQNTSGELGNGSPSTTELSPVPVTGGLGFAMIAPSVNFTAPGDYTCAITLAGKAYCWGANHAGQLGDGTTTDRLVPTAVLTSEIFVAIGTGESFTCGMTAARKVFCWGSNAQGEMGSGVAGGIFTTPVAVSAPFN